MKDVNEVNNIITICEKVKEIMIQRKYIFRPRKQSPRDKWIVVSCEVFNYGKEGEKTECNIILFGGKVPRNLTIPLDMFMYFLIPDIGEN